MVRLRFRYCSISAHVDRCKSMETPVFSSLPRAVARGRGERDGASSAAARGFGADPAKRTGKRARRPTARRFTTRCPQGNAPWSSCGLFPARRQFQPTIPRRKDWARSGACTA